MFKRILVATDGSTRSNHALKAAARFAKTFDASLTIFHAIPEYRMPYYPESAVYDWPSEAQYIKDSVKEAAKLLGKARALVAKYGVKATVAYTHSDAPSEALIKAARKVRADVIVMASHGRKGLERLLLGSETQKVLTHSKLPVLVVR